MRLSTFLLAASAAAGAYVAARRLMADATLVARLPAPARGPAARLRAKLLGAREVVAEGFHAGRTERDAAERELTQEYRRRAGRR